GHAHDAQDIDVQDAVPLLVIVGLDRALRADARVVDDDVDAAELLRDRLHAGLHGRVIRDVDLLREVLDAVRVDVEHGDVRAQLRELRGGRRADPRRSAGDDGGQSRHVECHGYSFVNACGFTARTEPGRCGWSADRGLGVTDSGSLARGRGPVLLSRT